MPHPGTVGHVLAGRYRLERLVASGGMAQVWEATDEVLTRRVAVKLLHPHLAADATFVERFRREAIAAARLAHPSIVAIYDTCSEDGTEAIVMELVRGTTLRALLDERGYLEAPQAVAIASQVADALSVAHRAGIIHRDIKPANILLSEDGRVLVADFGIAKAGEGADMTGTGTTLGTVKYLAPEQVRGDPVDARTDVYALGVVLYECLCGRPPFVADSDAATALARLHQQPLRPRNIRASISKPMDDVVMRALSLEPAGRYASAGDLRAALLAASRGEAPPEPLPTTAAPRPTCDATIADAPSGPPTQAADPTPAGAPRPPVATPPTTASARRPPRRSRRGPIFVGLLVLAALVVVAVLVSQSSGSTHKIGGATTSDGATTAGLVATAFDPFGSGGENDADAPKAVDGNPETLWSTEGYDSRTFGTKPGVGLVVTLPSSAAIDTLTVVSPTNDWSASIYVSDSAQSSLDAWGSAVTSKAHIAKGTTSFDLGGHRGRAVLLWITDLGDEAGRAHARIAEVTVSVAT